MSTLTVHYTKTGALDKLREAAAYHRARRTEFRSTQYGYHEHTGANQAYEIAVRIVEGIITLDDDQFEDVANKIRKECN